MDSQPGNPSGQQHGRRRQQPGQHSHEQALSDTVSAMARYYTPVSQADIGKYGAEFLVPYEDDEDEPSPQLSDMDLPLYNPDCWPVEWMAEMVANGADLATLPIRVPYHRGAPADSPFTLNFHASAYGVACEDDDRLHADLARLLQPLPLVHAHRNKHGRAGNISNSNGGGFVVDSDGDVVMMDDEDDVPPPTMHDIERHSVDSFRAELAKDPSAKVTLANPPPPQHLLPPRSFEYQTGLIFSATCPPPDPAFLLGCDCTATRPCILPSGRVNPACKHGDDAYGHATVPAYTSDGRLRSLVQLQNSTFLPVASPFVIECNVNCACARFASSSASTGPACKNRVAQHGIRHRLVIGHAEGKGLGVFAGERIPQGAFVVEYAGEVLMQAELSRRDEEWAAIVGGGGGRRAGGGTTMYSFNADWMVDGSDDAQMAKVKAIEARYRGNCSRFFNHSCSPNLIVGAIQYDMDDPYMHRIGFFALRDIAAGEELAFDYHGGDRSSTEQQVAGCEAGRGSRRSAAAALAKVGRKRSTRSRQCGGAGAASASASSSSRGARQMVDVDEEDQEKLTGLYKFQCLCGSDKCRGNVL